MLSFDQQNGKYSAESVVVKALVVGPPNYRNIQRNTRELDTETRFEPTTSGTQDQWLNHSRTEPPVL